MSRGSFRHTVQTFNHTIWAAKNAARLVKGSIGAARSVSRKMRDTKRRLLHGPKSNVVARVRQKTRGSIDPRFYAKNTPAGAKRRADLAAKLRTQPRPTRSKNAPSPTNKFSRERSQYPGKIKLEKNMTHTQLKRRVTAYKRRDHVKYLLNQHQGDRKATASFIKNMRSQGLKPKFKTNSYDPLYKKTVHNYHKAFK